MHWTRGQTIGRGSSATVSMARANRSGQVFAVKSAELSKSESLQKEQIVLSTLRCPQIVAYKGCDITNENGKVLYNLFLEYASGGTLIDAIREGGGCLDEDMIRLYARTILLGLEYLHCNGIVHCDIKGHNILVTSDGAKIADLGCAKRVDEVSEADWGATATIAGTPLYMAPEVARAEHQGFPADIWAVGCTIVEMATGQAPWENNSSKADTPTCVLDQVLWDSVEKLETTWDSNQNTSLVSPIERIKQLTEGNGKAHSWSTWDDAWATIRSNKSSEEQEMVSCSEDHNMAYANGSIENSGEEIASLSMEHNFVVLDEPTSISGNKTCNNTSSGGSCGDGTRHKILLMPCEGRKDAL
ncbi:hypothetical protein D5086_007761, partial [Populus alba]